jgi:hypothetical protein
VGEGTVALSMKRRDFRRMSSIASGSSRKSDLRPTMTIGVPGQYWFTSSNHYRYFNEVLGERERGWGVGGLAYLCRDVV